MFCCSICLENFLADDEINVTYRCGHCFHANCLNTWFNIKKTCPQCSCSADPASVLPIYLNSASDDTPTPKKNQENSNEINSERCGMFHKTAEIDKAIETLEMKMKAMQNQNAALVLKINRCMIQCERRHQTLGTNEDRNEHTDISDRLASMGRRLHHNVLKEDLSESWRNSGHYGKRLQILRSPQSQRSLRIRKERPADEQDHDCGPLNCSSQTCSRYAN